MKLSVEINVTAIDELRFAEIYMHAMQMALASFDRGEDAEALSLLMSNCSDRLKAVMGILEASLQTSLKATA
jgi:hypothetical protein